MKHSEIVDLAETDITTQMNAVNSRLNTIRNEILRCGQRQQVRNTNGQCVTPPPPDVTKINVCIGLPSIPMPI